MKSEKKDSSMNKVAAGNLSATQFVEQLTVLATAPLTNNAKFFREPGLSNKFLGVRMAAIFALAKQFMETPLKEIEKLLLSDYYEVRLGAVSIMDFQARNKKIAPEKRKALYDLYIQRHDHIDNWDLVDRSAPYVIGGYLFDKSRAPLYKLAGSKSVWERRTAIVSTYFFIRQNDVGDTFKIAEILIHDQHDLINKAVGSWVREAGKRAPDQLIAFLCKYAASMPRVTLRYAIENLDGKQQKMFMGAAK